MSKKWLWLMIGVAALLSIAAITLGCRQAGPPAGIPVPTPRPQATAQQQPHLAMYFAEDVTGEEPANPPEGYRLFRKDRWSCLAGTEPDFTEADVQAVRLAKARQYGPDGSIVRESDQFQVVFTIEAAERLARQTEANSGKVLLILLNEEVLTAPVVRNPITGGSIPIPLEWISPSHERILRSMIANQG